MPSICLYLLTVGAASSRDYLSRLKLNGSQDKRRRTYSLQPTAYRLGGLALLSALVFVSASQADDIPPLSASKAIHGLSAADLAVAIPAGKRVFYHVDDVSPVENNKGVRRQTISGETISVSVYQLDIGVAVNLALDRADNRDDEYVVFVVNGAVEIGIEGKQTRLASMGMAAVPVDVRRTPARIKALSKTVLLVYSSFVPANQTEINLPRTQKGKIAPTRSVIFANFDSIDRRHKPGNSSLKSAFGHRCTVSLWRTAARDMPGVYAPGHHHDIEQISYILGGHAKARVGNRIRKLATGSIMLVPANVDHGPIGPIGDETVLILDFQPLLRRDLKQRMAQ